MALRTTLSEVVDMVREEADLSTATSRGIDHRDNIKRLIIRNHKMLAEDFDWQHLEIKKESSVGRKLLQAGSRTYNFPTALNPLKIRRAFVKWGSSWLELDYGVKYEQFSAFDPDSNQRSDPITNWDFYSDSEFEVFPLPASNGTANGANEMAFEGQKKVTELVADASRLDMDDILVSLLCATEILASNDRENAAKIKGAAAEARLNTVRGNLRSKIRYRMGLGRVDASGFVRPRHPTYIR
jgi:hypothetical protein